MALCFQLGTLNTAWAPLSLLFRALFILTLSPIMSITEAKYIDVKAEGWAIPTVEKPLRIGIPVKTFSDRFVNVQLSIKNPDEKIYSGFCIDAFEEVVKTLSSTFYLHHEFVLFNGSYDDLVTCVANETFDAAVGDITILAERWKVVDFTAPFTEQGVSLVVSMNSHARSTWLFLKPFTMEMWIATWIMFMYTGFVVWLLEHRSNPFCDTWKDQLGNVLWFTFSSLFFAHKEKIQSNYTRIVIVVWLFVVLILIQSYTASLTSMLTVSKLNPNVDSLKKTDAVVGCFGNDVVTDYLVNVLHFKKDNIRDDITTQSQYLDAFKSGTISAAFLDVPYAKAIVRQYCDQLAFTGPTFKSGGFGFAFPKGSPIVANVSEAILTLMEDGTVKKLEDEYFPPSSDCSSFETAKDNGHSLSLHNFWGLYIVYLAISTICLLLFFIRSLYNQGHSYKVLPEDNITSTCASAQKKIVALTQFLNNNADSRDPGKAPFSDQAPNYIGMR